MQGQRGALGSLPEAFEADHASSSSNAAMNNQLFWSDVRGPSASYVLPPGETIPFINSINHDNLSGWSIGESSSRRTQQEDGDSGGKLEIACSSSVGLCGGSGLRLEDHAPRTNTNTVSLTDLNTSPLLNQNLSCGFDPQNLNLSSGCSGQRCENAPLAGCQNLHKSTESDCQQFIPSNGSNRLVIGSEPREESNGSSSGSFDGRRVCKRKSFEEHDDQSSGRNNRRFLQQAESSVFALPDYFHSSSSSSAAAGLEQADSRLGLGDTAVASSSLPIQFVVGSSESSQSNTVNSLGQGNLTAPVLSSAVTVPRNSTVASSMQSLRIPVDCNLPSTIVPSDVNGPRPRAVRPLFARPPIRSCRGPVPGPSSSSGPFLSGNRGGAIYEEGSSSRSTRNISEHPMLVPSTLVPPPITRGMTALSIPTPGNVPSSSRASSSSAPPQPSQHWPPQQNRHVQYPRRLSEYVRRSLLASIGSDPEGNHNHPSPSSMDPFLHDAWILSGPGDNATRQSLPASAIWAGRHGDGAQGVPHSMRTLAAASQGRRRLVSEIRGVLDLMRRGEGLRFEDVMILDHSMLVGVADIHDRHRDMRLDVDNMSYEELLALEERIGNVSTGLKEENILSRMKQRKYTVPVETQQEAEPCCICQEEYNEGEDLGALECGHDFHSECIKQWLMHKNLCPICKTTGLAT